MLLLLLAWSRSAHADVLFSNFDANTDWAFGSGEVVNQPVTEYETAMRFVPAMTGTVDSVVLPVFTEAEQGFYLPPPPPGTLFGDSMNVALYADDNGQPGGLLELREAHDVVPFWLAGPPLPTPVTVAFSGATQLTAGEAYWIGLVETESTALFWLFSNDMAEAPRLVREAGSSTWEPALFTRSGLQVHGTPVPGAGGAAALGFMLALLRGRRRGGETRLVASGRR